ncbi:ATP-binding protein [Kitasatospora sp. NPDC001603]|uniref:ATP-binding protein n=1 Tax=Kitasatospora sp. NPDC001603 TaxID=3154388 RepID=UPI00331894CC
MGDKGGGVGRGLPRALVVRRLRERQAAGELTSRHVRAVADTVGVSVRTVWRWLAEANASGEVDGKPARQGYAMSDRTWALLAVAGGNVAELHRRMLASGEEGVPPLGTLHRVVRRDRLAGRVLVIEREAGLAEPLRSDPLAELGLATVSGVGLGGQVFLREQTRLAAVPVLVPGAQVVVTPVVASVVRCVAHVAAVGAVACLYGDAGHGKTVALQYALSQLPEAVRVRRVYVGVNPSVPELRRVLAEALELRRLPHSTGAADLMLLEALRRPRVLVLDEAQRLPAAACGLRGSGSGGVAVPSVAR